jgi:cobalt-zinc-cadmium efflux system outer membrane protein
MSPKFRPAAAAVAFLALAGCAGLPRERGYSQTQALIEARRDMAPPGSLADFDSKPPLPTAPLDANEAVRLAFFYNPRIREEYARIGLGRAELEDARRIANPSFGYVRLSPHDGHGNQTTRSVSVGLTDLLLLPARKRFAQGELERLQQSVAASLLELATEVEAGWYAAVSAEQVAQMRDVVAQAAEASAELAQRFFDAGNITRLQLEQELASASQARIEAVRARAEALRSRSEVAGLIGLSSTDAWTLQAQLPAPPETALSTDVLVPLALENRLDLAAARRAVALREDTLGVSRRWRWLGSVEVGYERESEIDGEVLRGPSLSLELPIFNQGQGAVARAQAELMQARAELDAMVLNVHNTARLSVEELNVAREIAERYRTELVPRREAIVARMQEEVNYMLVGIFELLLAKQEEYDAYQEYLEAVRDYWTTRAQLRGAVGGRLPDDDAPLTPTIGVDAILPSGTPAPMDHGNMDHGAMDAGQMDHGTMDDGAPVSDDPHAGHAMPAAEKDAADDPHAGHSMPAAMSEKGADPHAGHVMPPAEKPEADDPHAGHAMPPAPADDPHAGHAIPPSDDAQAIDPHAGHSMPEPDDTKATKEEGGDATDDEATHDHGDTP